MEKNNIIGVYAICKNESKFLEKWVENMIKADYISVLDTGSDDNTYEELQRLATEINTKYGYDKMIIDQKIIDPWRFDIPRNIALHMLPEECNVFVSVDLDELFEQDDWVNILRENWINSKHTRGNYKYVWSHTESGENGRVFNYNKIHDKEWTWRYPVHETLCHILTKDQSYHVNNCCYLGDKIILHHYPDRTKSRSSYLPLLELRAKEDPTDYYGLVYLAHEYKYRGYYQKSIDLLNRILSDFKERTNNIEKASCYLFMGDDYKELNDYSNSERCYLKCIEIEPTYREGYLAYSGILIELKKYTLARIYCKEALMKTYRHYTWLERDHSWNYEPYDLLALASFYSGHKLESLAYAYKAWTLDKENVRLKNNIELIINNMNPIDYANDNSYYNSRVLELEKEILDLDEFH